MLARWLVTASVIASMALGYAQILDAARAFEQEVDQPLQVHSGYVAEANLERPAEDHFASCLRLASSFACKAASTSAAAWDVPVCL